MAHRKILNSWLTDNYIIEHCNGLYNRLQRAKFLKALWFQNFIWIFIQRVLKDSLLQPWRWKLSWDNPGTTHLSEQQAPLESQCRCCWHTWAPTTLCFQIFPPTWSSHSGGDALPCHWSPHCPWVCQLLPVPWHWDTNPPGAGADPDSPSRTVSAQQNYWGFSISCPTAEIPISVTKPSSLLPNPGQGKGWTELFISRNVAASSSSCLSSVWTCPTPWGSSSVCTKIRRQMRMWLFPVQDCILCHLLVSDAKPITSNVF